MTPSQNFKIKVFSLVALDLFASVRALGGNLGRLPHEVPSGASDPPGALLTCTSQGEGRMRIMLTNVSCWPCTGPQADGPGYPSLTA